MPDDKNSTLNANVSLGLASTITSRIIKGEVQTGKPLFVNKRIALKICDYSMLL